MSIVLGQNNYGKSRVRLVKVSRHPGRHDLKELTVNIQFEGDFESSYSEGDNSKVLPTDTMKNTVYVLAAQHPVEEIEEFARVLIGHFLHENAQVSRVRIEIAEHLWTRLANHSFTPSGTGNRIATVTGTRKEVSIESGIEDLVVLKTTDSAFEGYIKDRYTTLKETSDRILATAIRADWRYLSNSVEFGALWSGVRQTIVEVFSEHQSRSVQHTLYAIGEAVLKCYPDISEIRISMPNKHCLPVDLTPFGLENQNEIFVPIDEPHGLIEATVRRNPGPGQ